VRIAILGGTFDPIHNGHLRVAQTVVDTFGIDEVHFIPAFTPPHKARPEITSAFHRFAMVALAIASYDLFRVSTLEVDRLEARYTVNTLESMRDRYPDAALLFITGTDLFVEIEEWSESDRLFELASFAVVNRPGCPMRHDLRSLQIVAVKAKTTLSRTPRVYYLPNLNEDISSTKLREQLCDGRDVDEWIPRAVLAYIHAHKLYS